MIYDMKVVSRDFSQVGGSITIDAYIRSGDCITVLICESGLRWYHNIGTNWKATRSVPELYLFSEEELFQYSTVCNFGDPELYCAVQNLVLQNILFLKENPGIYEYTLEY